MWILATDTENTIIHAFTNKKCYFIATLKTKTELFGRGWESNHD
jgi:hypothetical protein